MQPGSRKAGLFWHTQGSGKSISICCYAGKLLQQPAMKNPTLVVVTDRNELAVHLTLLVLGGWDVGGQDGVTDVSATSYTRGDGLKDRRTVLGFRGV